MPTDLKQAIYNSLTAGKRGVQAAFDPMRLGGPDAEGGLRAALFGGLGAASVPIAAMDEAALGVGNVIAEDTGRAAAAVERAGHPNMASGVAGGGVALGMLPFIGSMALDPEMGAAKAAGAGVAQAGRMGAANSALRDAVEKIMVQGASKKKIGDFSILEAMPGYAETIARQPRFSEQTIWANKLKDAAAFNAYLDDFTRAKKPSGSISIAPERLTPLLEKSKDLKGMTPEAVLAHEFAHSMRGAAGRDLVDTQLISGHTLSKVEALADKYAENVTGSKIPRVAERKESIERQLKSWVDGWDSENKDELTPQKLEAKLQRFLKLARATYTSKKYSEEVVPAVRRLYKKRFPDLQYAVPIVAGAGVASQGEQ